MALTISRSGHSAGRPTLEGGGSNGWITTHSASVRSLAKRSPSRLCCARVVAVHIRMFFQLGLDNLLKSHPSVTTQPPFRQRSETASKRGGSPSVKDVMRVRRLPALLP